MIKGVTVKKLVVHPDIQDVHQPETKQGILAEILRSDEDLFSKFGQSTFTITHPGTIKGFHWHEKQDDLWFVATGKVVIVLHDLREASPTFRKTETIYAGAGDYKLVVIPTGVAHGYKVLSEEPVILFYHTTEAYDAKSPDEKRVPYDDPSIGFDWNQYS